jgi:hypothetical protein
LLKNKALSDTTRIVLSQSKKPLGALSTNKIAKGKPDFVLRLSEETRQFFPLDLNIFEIKYLVVVFPELPVTPTI